MVGTDGQCSQQLVNMHNLPSNMIGNTPEVRIEVDNVRCKCLLDTGSQISTMSQGFYETHCLGKELQDCSKLIRIEGVGGNILPYHGYLNCKVSVPLNDSVSFTKIIPFLVVNNTKYNKTVPILLGTNFISKIVTESTVQVSAMNSCVQIAVHIMQLNDRHLDKSMGVFSNVVTSSALQIPANSGIIVECQSTVVIPITRQIALIEQSNDIQVVPGLTEIKQGICMIPVELINDTNNEVCIEAGVEVAKLHKASVQVPESNDGET